MYMTVLLCDYNWCARVCVFVFSGSCDYIVASVYLYNFEKGDNWAVEISGLIFNEV